MTVILSTPAPGSATRPRLAAASLQERQQRLDLQDGVRANEARARLAAEAGDLAQAARFILAALDGERRMAAAGPQVLQVIKPRA